MNISIYVSITIGSQLPSAPDPEQSSTLGRTPVRWVRTKEVAWHRTSVEVMGSRTSEFPLPLARHVR
jgi:hypothetical protein